VGVVAIRSPALADGVETGLRGHCPVSYHVHGKAVLGDSAFQSTFQGYRYELADPESKTKFDTDPEKYVPRFGGLCTTALGGPYGNRIPPDPSAFKIVDGKLYMFSSERALRSFVLKPPEYINAATERFAKPAIGGYCPVSYHTAKAAVKGDEKFQQQHRTRIYYFADAAAKEAFLKDPEKYVPAYEGVCAEGVAQNKRFPADPRVFLVHEGRLFLFFDDKAKKTFEANPQELIKSGEINWRELKNVPAP
jgi:YHS domain-containing protein